MSLTVAPKVNLETISNLSADKQYFLSSTTGEIKEASFWMRFKCAIGIQSARQKVSNLIDAVRSSLLEAAKQNDNIALDNDIKTVNMKYMVKGSVITDIAKRFSATNAANMMKSKAESVVRSEARMLVNQLLTQHFNIGDSAALEKIIRHALKPQLAGKLPTTVDDKGRQVLDTRALRISLHDALNEARTLIEDISRSGKDGDGIDECYANHIIAKLFNRDGTRTASSVDDLKTKLDAQVEYTFIVKDAEIGSRRSSLYDTLAKIGEKRGIENFQAEMLKKLFDFCGDDKTLKGYVLENAPEIMMDSNAFLRSDEKIKAKIDGIRSNIEEIRSCERDMPGCTKLMLDFMQSLGSDSFPPGTITTMKNCVQNAKLDKLRSLNGLSSAEDIFAGLEEIRRIILDFNGQVKLEMGGAISGAGGGALVALAAAKAGPAFMARLPNIIKSAAFGKTQSFILVSHAEMSRYNGIDEIPNRKEKLNILTGHMKNCDFLANCANVGRDEPIEAIEYAESGLDFNEPELSRMIDVINAAAEE